MKNYIKELFREDYQEYCRNLGKLVGEDVGYFCYLNNKYCPAVHDSITNDINFVDFKCPYVPTREDLEKTEKPREK